MAGSQTPDVYLSTLDIIAHHSRHVRTTTWVPFLPPAPICNLSGHPTRVDPRFRLPVSGLVPGLFRFWADFCPDAGQAYLEISRGPPGGRACVTVYIGGGMRDLQCG